MNAMESSVSSTLATIYIYIHIYVYELFWKQHNYKYSIENNTKIWLRYMDDILIMWTGSIFRRNRQYIKQHKVHNGEMKPDYLVT